MSNMDKRVFTTEDKKLRPKVYVQTQDPLDNDNTVHFKIDNEKEVDGEVLVSGDIYYSKDGVKKKLTPNVSADSIKIDNETLPKKVEELTDIIYYDTLYAANWITGTNNVPFYQKLEYTIPKEYDVIIAINTSNQDIVRDCAAANIISGEHKDTNIVVNAFGPKPIYDIPIKLIVRHLSNYQEEDYILKPATQELLGGVIPGEGFEVKDATLDISDIKNTLNDLSEASL